MSISSILGTGLPETPPQSRNRSFRDDDGAEAPQVPPPELTTSPVNDPELSVTDAGTLTPSVQLYSVRPRTDAIDDYEAIIEDKPLNAAPTNSSPAAGKGKGKDPELYDPIPTEDGNTTDRQVDRSTEYNAAESLVRLRNIDVELDSVAFILLNLSESEDEGPPLHTARKRGFSTSYHGIHLQHFAHEGNAVFALLETSSRRNQETRLHHQNLEVHSGETKWRHREVAQESIHAQYVEDYRALGCREFEREDTVPLDDDAAEYNGKKDGSEMLSGIPKLSQKTLDRLEVERLEWRPTTDPLMATSSDTSGPVTEALEPIRPPLYAEESSTRGSVNPSATIDPDATAEENAHDSPPTSSQRPSYTDRRSGESYPLASNFVDLAETISSPSPPTRRARQNKTVTPSSLKQVQTASESDHRSPPPEQHVLPTGPLSNRPSAKQSKHAHRSSVKKFLPRAELTNEFVRLGLPISTAPRKQKRSVTVAEAGPSTPKKRLHTETARSPTPAASGRKRKAATQGVEVEGHPPAPLKKQKGTAVPASERPRTRAAEREEDIWYVNREKDFVKREIVDEAGRAKATATARTKSFLDRLAALGTLVEEEEEGVEEEGAEEGVLE